MMTVVDVSCPLCSVNKKYLKAKSGRLILSPEYRAFKETVAAYCRQVEFKPPYRVEIEFIGREDIDNIIKPILDALQLSGVIKNDRNIAQLEIVKHDKKKMDDNRLIVKVGTIAEVVA